jgi:hypothetical protein
MDLRKSVVGRPSTSLRQDVDDDERWLDLARVARVEVTSEDPDHPIEGALVTTGDQRGWRAGHAGPQTVRLLFDRPLRLQRIQLLFVEPATARTQEFVLRWSAEGALRDIVRQQWNFSPEGSMREAEDYRVDLEGATALELEIVPDVSGGATPASLARWRVA